jgi:hypothetical protein
MKKIRKPVGWPKYMRAKRLRNGLEAYFWEPPTWARRNNCPVNAEALGSDYAIAKQRCDEVLNVQFDAWRTKDESPIGTVGFGTFDWMASVYKRNRLYSSRPERTKRDIDRSLELASKFILKDGRTFGMLQVKSITPGVADRLFAFVRNLTAPPGIALHYLQCSIVVELGTWLDASIRAISRLIIHSRK